MKAFAQVKAIIDKHVKRQKQMIDNCYDSDSNN